MNPWPLQSECMTFYGNPYKAGWLHANTVDVVCPWPLSVEGIATQHILIHKKCADSLVRVLNNIWEAVGKDLDRIKLLRYNIYDGSYNLRPMRGSKQLSMHSFACAIDWDASDNPFHNHLHLFKSDSILVLKFKEEGWSWGGDWSNPDAMHVQAARVHA